MLEFDYLENFDDKSIEDLEYDKIYWENKFGWEHYLEYEVWYDMGPWECVGEEFCNQYQQQWEYVCNECSKIVDFCLGINYHNLNGYYEDKYYGLHLLLENGEKKLWSNDMKIIRKPGVVLNRHLLLNDILK